MKINTAIIVPLKSELKRLRNHLEENGDRLKVHNTGKKSAFISEKLKTLLCLGGHGKTGSAITAQHIIEQFHDLKLIICAGTAGSLVPEVSPGDVVIGRETIEHDYKMRFINKPLPSFNSCTNMIDQLASTRSLINMNFSVHYGTIASGDEDIVDLTRKEELRAATGALCTAWEGAGVAKAAKFNHLGFIEIRAISDNSDSDNPEEFTGNLDSSMLNLSITISEVLKLRAGS